MKTFAEELAETASAFNALQFKAEEDNFTTSLGVIRQNLREIAKKGGRAEWLYIKRSPTGVPSVYDVESQDMYVFNLITISKRFEDWAKGEEFKVEVYEEQNLTKFKLMW